MSERGNQTLKYIRHILLTKGPIHSIERSVEIVRRFVGGKNRFRRLISTLEALKELYGVRFTFCITASLLKRHFDLIQQLKKAGHEIAVHGHFHTRMDLHSRREQEEMINRSYLEFTRSNFQVKGFRCPYLSYNHQTIESLKKSPFRWTSGKIILYENGGPLSAAARTGLQYLYHFSENGNPISLPDLDSNLVELPITAPDDEMLLERMRVRSTEKITETWLHLFERSLKNGELCHFFFHPERLPLIREALENLLRAAVNPDSATWIPTLDELADWWSKRSKFSWKLDPESTPKKAILDASAEATILLKGSGNSDRDPVIGNYYEIDPIQVNGSQRVFPAEREGKTMTIGLSAKSPVTLESFLQLEGFIVQRSCSPQHHSIFIDRESFSESDKRLVLHQIDQSPNPVLRLWRWPNNYRSALSVSADVCAIDFRDFIDRTLHF